jgi:hypothetical protein
MHVISLHLKETLFSPHYKHLLGSKICTRINKDAKKLFIILLGFLFIIIFIIFRHNLFFFVIKIKCKDNIFLEYDKKKYANVKLYNF